LFQWIKWKAAKVREAALSEKWLACGAQAKGKGTQKAAAQHSSDDFQGMWLSLGGAIFKWVPA